MDTKFTDVYGCTKKFQIHNQYNNSMFSRKREQNWKHHMYGSYFSDSLIQDELPFPRLENNSKEMKQNKFQLPFPLKPLLKI